MTSRALDHWLGAAAEWGVACPIGVEDKTAPYLDDKTPLALAFDLDKTPLAKPRRAA